MNKKMPEPIRLWIEELRSGEHTQTQGALQHGESYCCLGVACIAARKNNIEIIIEGSTKKTKGLLDGISLRGQIAVQNWLKLENPYGKFKEISFEGVYSLANLNDDTRLNFLQIANVIEDNWEYLVKE